MRKKYQGVTIDMKFEHLIRVISRNLHNMSAQYLTAIAVSAPPTAIVLVAVVAAIVVVVNAPQMNGTVTRSI